MACASSDVFLGGWGRGGGALACERFNMDMLNVDMLTRLRTAIAGGGRSSWGHTLPDRGVRARPTFLMLPPPSRSMLRSATPNGGRGDAPLLPAHGTAPISHKCLPLPRQHAMPYNRLGPGGEGGGRGFVGSSCRFHTSSMQTG